MSMGINIDVCVLRRNHKETVTFDETTIMKLENSSRLGRNTGTSNIFVIFEQEKKEELNNQKILQFV